MPRTWFSAPPPPPPPAESAPLVDPGVATGLAAVVATAALLRFFVSQRKVHQKARTLETELASAEARVLELREQLAEAAPTAAPTAAGAAAPAAAKKEVSALVNRRTRGMTSLSFEERSAQMAEQKRRGVCTMFFCSADGCIQVDDFLLSRRVRDLQQAAADVLWDGLCPHNPHSLRLVMHQPCTVHEHECAICRCDCSEASGSLLALDDSDAVLSEICMLTKDGDVKMTKDGVPFKAFGQTSFRIEVSVGAPDAGQIAIFQHAQANARHLVAPQPPVCADKGS